MLWVRLIVLEDGQICRFDGGRQGFLYMLFVAVVFVCIILFTLDLVIVIRIQHISQSRIRGLENICIDKHICPFLLCINRFVCIRVFYSYALYVHYVLGALCHCRR